MEYTYRDLQPLTHRLRLLLHVAVAFNVMSLISSGYQRYIFRQLIEGDVSDPVSFQIRAEASDLAEMLISLPNVLLLLIIFVFAGMWIYRAARNVRAMGAHRLDCSPGWAVGWYFVPFACLLKPFQAMNEIWRASADSNRWEHLQTPGVLRLWWALWLISNILGQAVFRLGLRAEELDELLRYNSVMMLDDLLSIPLNLVFAHVLTRIANMQTAQPSPLELELTPTLPAPM